MEIFDLIKLLIGAVPLFMAISILLTSFSMIRYKFYDDPSSQERKKISIKKED